MKHLITLLLFTLVACNPAPAVIVRTVPPGTGDAAATPEVTGELRTEEPFCAGAPPTRIILGVRGRVTDDDESPLNVRAAPGLGSEILLRIAPGGVFFVTDGPACADGYVWYRIEYGEVQGWVAEGDASVYYIEPYLPG